MKLVRKKAKKQYPLTSRGFVKPGIIKEIGHIFNKQENQFRAKKGYIRRRVETKVKVGLCSHIEDAAAKLKETGNLH